MESFWLTVKNALGRKKKKNKITKNFHRTPAKEKGSCVPDIESGCWKSPRNSFQVDSTQPLQTYSVYRLYFMKFFFFSRGILSFHIKNKKIRVQKKVFVLFLFLFLIKINWHTGTFLPSGSSRKMNWLLTSGTFPSITRAMHKSNQVIVEQVGQE